MIFKNKNKNKTFIKSAFVLGSSSEIAKQICMELSKKGCKVFHLLARKLDDNKELIKILKQSQSVKVTQEKFDALDNLGNLPKVKDFDLYIIAVGALGNNQLASYDHLEAIKIIDSNYAGLIPWLIAITQNEKLKLRSRLWIFSSVAGDIGRPSNYHYGAAKSALTTFAYGLFLKCINKPFAVRIFKTGFIETRMSIGKVPKILCMKPSTLAKKILKNPNRRGIEYLPWWWFLIMKILLFAPNIIKSRL